MKSYRLGEAGLQAGALYWAGEIMFPSVCTLKIKGKQHMNVKNGRSDSGFSAEQ